MVSEMGECVLVVDDDREIVKAISILLEGEGYEVLKAYDGLQALDILASRQVRLVLMDVMFLTKDKKENFQAPCNRQENMVS